MVNSRCATTAPGTSSTRATRGAPDPSSAPQTYTIVGSHEASPADGRISSTSPIGRALMGGHAGDTVTVAAPRGSFGLRIVSLA